MVDDNEQGIIAAEVAKAVELERSIAQATDAMMQVPEFRQFLEQQQQAQSRLAELWKQVEGVLVEAYKQGKIDKTIKGDWGSLTIVERYPVTADKAVLGQEYFKTVPDEKKIRDTYHLTGEAPAGATVEKKLSLRKDLKLGGGDHDNIAQAV